LLKIENYKSTSSCINSSRQRRGSPASTSESEAGPEAAARQSEKTPLRFVFQIALALRR